MTLYRYDGITKQNGTVHENKIVAVKVDPGGSPVFTVLDETTADNVTGSFVLEWGDESANANENWAGRVLVVAVDDDDTVKLDCQLHDYRVGSLILAVFGSGILLFDGVVGLSAAYTMGNISGASLVDETVNSNDGTIVGASQAMGFMGHCLEFDGIDDQVTVLTDPSLVMDEWTLGGWIRQDSTPDGGAVIAEEYTGSGDRVGGTIKFATGVGDVNGSVLVGGAFSSSWYGVAHTTMPNGEWYHAMVTYDAVNIKFYVDGVLIGTANIPGSFADSNSWYLGRRWDAFGNSPFFHGALSDFRIFNRAASFYEVLEMYAEPPIVATDTYPDLVAYWTMDRVSGATLVDEVGTSDGVIVGAVQAAGLFTNALSFTSAAGDVVNFSVPDVFSTFGVTISLWAYPTSVKQWARFIELASGTSGQNAITVTREDTTNNIRIIIKDAGGSSTVLLNSVGGIVLNTWNHIVAVFDPAVGVYIYKDGEILATLLGAFTIPSAMRGSSALGIDAGSGNPSYDGLMDNVRIFDHPLNAEQVAKLFTEVQPIINKGHPDLLQFFNMEDVSGATLLDASVQGNDGTIAGTPISLTGGVLGSGYAFLDLTDYIATGGILPNDNFTVSWWMSSVVAHGGDPDVIFGRGDTGESIATNAHLLSILGSGNFEVFTETGAGDNHAYDLGVGPTQDGNWHHYTYTIDAGSVSIYEDMVLIAGPVPITVADTTSTNGGIGLDPLGAASYSNIHETGVDLFRIFNRPLTYREMCMLFIEGNP